jgi:predicted O-methyltransferase YrrM
MEKLAIVTLVTSPEWRQLAAITLPSQRCYAERLVADFVVLDKRVYPHPHYDKWQIYDLLGCYDRILYLDADMIVRPDCPDLFVTVPPEYVGGENELPSWPPQRQNLERFCQRLGIGPLPCPYYLNAGLFVVSTRHRELFRPPEAIPADLPCPEQSHFNVRLIGEQCAVCLLPSAFNDRYRQGDYLRRSFILHYAAMPHWARMQAIPRDLESWDQLFRHRTGQCNGLVSPPQAAPRPSVLPDHDYVSPGLESVNADRFFPDMVVGDKIACSWPYLRREVPHHWYVDRRVPAVGFLNRDEAHILYNTALRFRGRPALEIGCWLGWSSCHLALAGVQLDVVDPILERHDFHASVAASLEAAGVHQAVNLVGGFSPQKVHQLAAQRTTKWSLFFIDGNHDAPCPLQDAMACEACADADALILFHDLVSPDVAQALDYLQDKGWHTRLYQTMQIMAAAWRGDVKPVEHIPDPTVAWSLPDHLRRHFVAHNPAASSMTNAALTHSAG